MGADGALLALPGALGGGSGAGGEEPRAVLEADPPAGPPRGLRRHDSMEIEAPPAAASDPGGDPGKESSAAGFVARAVAARPLGCLYFVHFLSFWTYRSWTFLAVMVLVQLSPGSLLTTAVFGLCEATAVTFGVPFLGPYIDATEGQRAFLKLQGVQQWGAAGACIAVLAVLGVAEYGPVSGLGVAAIFVAGALTSAAHIGSKIILEKRWIVKLSEDTDALARANSAIKAMDLASLVVAPLLFGAIASWANLSVAVGLLGVSCALAFLLQSKIVPALARECPVLDQLDQPTSSWLAVQLDQVGALEADTETPSRHGLLAAEGAEGEGVELLDGQVPVGPGSRRKKKGLMGRLGGAGARARRAVRDYRREPVAQAAFSLAVLYMTVLSFGNIMTGYLRAFGALDVEVAVFRSLGAVTGLAAAAAYQFVHRRVSLAVSGALGVWFQAVCVSAAAIACMPWVPLGRGGRFACLVVLVCCSRFGLWTFDMSVTQMIQESVAGDRIGRFNTLQESLQKAFEMVMFLLTMGFSGTDDFWILACISAGGVVAAAANFTLGWRWHNDFACKSCATHARP